MREQARNKYRELSNEEKDIKREYGTNRYQKMPKQNKQRFKENKKKKKNYSKAKEMEQKALILDKN